MKKKKVWTNKKYGKQAFEGSYRYEVVGMGGSVAQTRYLRLVGLKTGRRVELESHEAAKKLGWIAK